jgi:glycosyltransferase involved in cell wall biosynthesis
MEKRNVLKMRMILHFPFRMDPGVKSASQKRPRMILEAFQKSGYDVELVCGSSAERIARFTRIKNMIRAGEKFELVYSESSTTPHMLNDEDHIPRHPFIDTRFMRYCRRLEIPVALFYRDVHWRFPLYRKKMFFLGTFLMLVSYYIEAFLYSTSIDHLFLPCVEMTPYIPLMKRKPTSALPPGIDDAIGHADRRGTSKDLSLLYVGGLGNLYQLDELIEAMRLVKSVRLTLCTRRSEWETAGARYKVDTEDAISVVHESGENLAPLYAEADICLICVKPSFYWTITVPYKLYEYIEFGKPIMATKGMVTSRVIDEKGLGWTVPWDREAIAAMLCSLRDDRDRIQSDPWGISGFIKENTWNCRVQTIHNALKAPPAPAVRARRTRAS